MASEKFYVCPECGERHDLSKYIVQLQSSSTDGSSITKGALVCNRGKPDEHVTVIHLDPRGNVRRYYYYDSVPAGSIQTRDDRTVIKLQDEEIIFISSEEMNSDQNLAFGKIFYGMDKNAKKKSKIKIEIWAQNRG
ncbi:MAG: hypothetical protein ACFFD4_10455 [Candidatus Odinarchaeota archaeon]